MDDESIIEFRAGRDSYGLTQWFAALVTDRERREDGEWLRVLPKNSASGEDSRRVHEKDVRVPARPA